MNERIPAAASAARTVSICIPVYNGADMVERALRSVEAQTVRPLEVIAVDDGSTDDTPRVLERLEREGRLVAVRQANKGLPGARNTAIRHARGEWIVPLDCDDELDPRALELGLAALDRAPGAGWCICDIVRIGSDGDEVATTTLPDGPASTWLPAMLVRNFTERTLMLRRGMVLSLGGYDEEFRCYEDWELNIRMLRAGVTAAYAPGPLYRYIKTEGSITSNVPRMLKARRQLYDHHHRRLAEAGPALYRGVYARSMWGLGRSYWDQLHDPRAALGCLLESLRYEFDLANLLRVARARMFGASRERDAATATSADATRRMPSQ
jgi:glycosyltransferase involved in cell wall biosynthesis